MDIPQTKRQELSEILNGFTVSDPYRWLENNDDPEVQTWVKSQNQYTESILKDDLAQTFSKELTKDFKVVNYFNPVPAAGKYFYQERQPDEDQAVLYVKTGLEGVPVKLFDPNGLKDGNTVTISGWNQSKTGKYVAYSISEGGNEMGTVYIKEVESNTELEEKITHCRHPQIRWLPDESGFFYTRNPRPGTVPKNEEHLHAKVYFHKLGDNPDTDPLIFGENRPKDDLIGLSSSIDGRYLAISVAKNWAENEVYLYDHQSKVLRPLITSIPAKFSLIFLKDKVLLKTNYQANNQRILWADFSDLDQPVDQWKEFIPEKEFALQSILVTEKQILLEYLVDVYSEVFIFDYEGKEIGRLPLPKYSSLADWSGRKNEEEFFYSVGSFTCSKIIYRYDPKTKTYPIYRTTDSPLKPEDYEVKQEWYESKDQTKVPMFIVHKKGLIKDGTNPTILYGYGGFGAIQTPGFNRNLTPWLRRGGIFAVANIRGGGEFGEHWHKSGIKELKQNSFDDFIAAAEYLTAEKYTDKNHLGIMGGSNGGLLVSAVAVQRPDLFAAVCSRVPLTDMVRFSKFGMALRWVHEYGDPDQKEDLERILSWSPYHNLKIGQDYPNFLFTTASNDSRVAPFHAYKMAAALQAMNKGQLSLVWTELEAGHGSGKPIAKIVEGQALILSFFAKYLKLKLD